MKYRPTILFFSTRNMIKSSRYVKKSETSDLLMTYSSDDMIMNGEKSSFSRMMFDIGRLERIEEVVV